jgi:hypothetical protein
MKNIIRFLVLTAAKLALQIRIFRDVYEQWLENIKSAHREELEKIKSAHREELEKIKSAHREELEKIKSAHREELEKILVAHSVRNPLELDAIRRQVGFEISISYEKQSDLLSQLFETHGSDKGYIQLQNHPYPWTPHNYADFYSMLFEKRRETVKKVFECGIGTNNANLPSNMTSNGKPGASLRAWREYFSNAAIYGADIDSEILFEEARIKTFYMNQLDPNSVLKCWDEVGEESFDLIIDDGLHTFDAGRTLFENSINKLDTTGLYIIEDVALADLTKYREYLKVTDFKVCYVSLFDKNRAHLNDNSLIVIQKCSI